jgi:GTPase SAR1 family protein
MDVTMIGLQNAGKTSLLRVLAVSLRLRYRFCSCFELIALCRAANLRSSMCDQDAGSSRDPKQEPCERCIADHSYSSIPTVGFNMKRVTKGHVTLKW